MCQCLLFLNEAQAVADVLDGLVRPLDTPVTGINADDNLLMAYQVAFDLQENQNQPFLNAVIAALPTPAGATPPPSATPAAAAASSTSATASTPPATGATATTPATASAETKEEDNYGNRMVRLKSILSGDVPVNVHLNYLYGQNRTDLNILKLIKDKLEQRNSVTHNATVMAHAIMHVGTTSDTFLRDNLEWCDPNLFVGCLQVDTHICVVFVCSLWIGWRRPPTGPSSQQQHQLVSFIKVIIRKVKNYYNHTYLNLAHQVHHTKKVVHYMHW
jgi:26S proteasome regulatory subunit N2